LAHQKIDLENLWFARSHKFSSADNIVLEDQELAARELAEFGKAGGNAIVDMTSNNIGRNPQGLVNVSRATGLHVIMGTAYYIGQSHTPQMRIEERTEQEIADDFITDLTKGVGATGVRAGVIGEIGLSWPWGKNEAKVLRAAGIASKATGAAVNLHPGGNPEAPSAYVKVLKEVGTDLSRVVISHMTRTFPISARKERARLAAEGCFLEYDLFGIDGIYPTPMSAGFTVANDDGRLDQIAELIQDGFLDHVLMSQDLCYKVMLRAYGGNGYAHILKNIVPKMLKRGMSSEVVDAIMVNNPRRMLALA